MKVLKLFFLGFLLSSGVTNAHERFMLPSHTLLSGENTQSVTLMMSISNAIFHPDRPLGNNQKGLDSGELAMFYSLLNHQVITPTGVINKASWQAFSRVSVADVTLTESGTYRISTVQPDIPMTTYKTAEGTPAREWGPNPVLPEGAVDIVRRTTAARIESYVSLNQPSDQALKPQGIGLELTGETHPNDLFVGENAKFQLLFNGKKINSETSIKAIKGGTRHRNNRNEKPLILDKNGYFSFKPEQAGFYLLIAETSVEIEQPAPVDVKHYSLYVTLEVFPE